jgi:class 3 adenylate cyclase/tetratricopeptide (TPR) repeat protein
VLICTSCRKENPSGFRFCGYCGAPLTAEPAQALEERKIVSVLFCDLVGFTAASAQQDPEDVRRRIRPYHARLRQEIERYGGTVEKFIGDAVAAVFGAPFAHEDDAERAVRSGLAITEAIAELNEQDANLNLQVRVGINSGEAVVALAARVDEGEGIVTGDVVNTAARIQTIAPVNAVAVSESTYRATRRVFQYEPLAAASAKGKSEPLSLWRAKAARARYGSDIRREFRTPFVGRELEKPFLIATFERAAQQRMVQLMTIVGEPGVGKTRLIGELFSYVHAKPELTRWKQGRCLPYGEGITFWALGEIVKAEAGILESDSPQAALEKLRDSIPDTAGDPQWLLQRLAPLVGADSGAPAEREELFTAWRRFLEGLATRHPTVLVFEDLHWADDALPAFLDYLAEWSRDVPLLILCAARPELYERRPAWGAGLRNAQTINLNPLSDGETAELVSYLSRSIALSEQLERAVLERAGGNPLYAEEFVRFLADREIASPESLLDEGALPDSVHALIAARLDTLAHKRKSLLQDAAVVGNVFWSGALAEIASESEEELEIALHELTQKELVRPSRTTSMNGESEYSFWHILVRDVAYTQIPRADRARRHRAAAAWIERKAGERVEDLAEVLAHHYLQATELFEAAGEHDEAAALAERARRFLALAGERALGLDTAQAELRLSRALELTPHEDPERAVVVARWAEAVYQAGRLSEAADALDGVLESLRASGRTEVTARALQLRSRLAQRLGQGHRVTLAAEAVNLLEQRAPGQPLVDAYAQLASSHHLNGEYEDAIAAADRACEFARTLGLPEPARALGYRGYARASLGDEEGLNEMERALSLLVDAGVGFDAAILQNNVAIARYPLQGPARSLAAFEQGITFCEERGLTAVALFTAANCPGLLAELGRTNEATERADALMAALEGTGSAQDPCEVRASELAVRVAQGRGSTADEVESLIATTRTVGQVDVNVLGFAVAAAALVDEVPLEACRLLAELDRFPGVRGSSYYARQLPGMIRTALRAGDAALAKELADGIEPRYPLEEHALNAARAQLAERDGDIAGAATLYAEAADRWLEFGNVAERAYALLGNGRCLRRLDSPDAETPLGAASELFVAMGYAPALAEINSLLDRAVPEELVTNEHERLRG